MQAWQEWIANPTVQRWGMVILVAIVVFILVKVGQKILGRTISDMEFRYRTRKTISGIGFFVILIAAALIFNEELGGVGVALGVAGAGIAFALQEVITSIAGWAAIAVGSFYHVGDRVKLGDIVGDVIDVGVLRTTIMETGSWVEGDLYNGRIVRVANSFVFKQPVFNYSGEFGFLWDEVKVPLAHGSDRAAAHAIMIKVLDEEVGDYSRAARANWNKLVRKFLIEDAKVEPMVAMTFDADAYNYTLRYIVDYKKRRGTKHAICARLLDAFDQHEGIQVATSTNDLYMRTPVEKKEIVE